jgi:hypothetical protein
VADFEKLPGFKTGKTYPISYFTNYDRDFRARDGIFEYKGVKFERVGRNKISVLSISTLQRK